MHITVRSCTSQSDHAHHMFDTVTIWLTKSSVVIQLALVPASGGLFALQTPALNTRGQLCVHIHCQAFSTIQIWVAHESWLYLTPR
mgnify:CR=1 FL=1